MASASVRAFQCCFGFYQQIGVGLIQKLQLYRSLSACSDDRVDGVCQALGVVYHCRYKLLAGHVNHGLRFNIQRFCVVLVFDLCNGIRSSALLNTLNFSNISTASGFTSAGMDSTMERMFGSPLRSASSTHSSE